MIFRNVSNQKNVEGRKFSNSYHMKISKCQTTISFSGYQHLVRQMDKRKGSAKIEI